MRLIDKGKPAGMKPFCSNNETPTSFSITQALAFVGGTKKTAGGPGIVVLTQNQECIFSNAVADRLLHELRHGDARAGVPQTVTRCCQELQVMLMRHASAKTWGRVQLTRVLGEEGRMVLIRLQAIPAPTQHAPGYLTLGLLEPYASRELSLPSPIPSDVQLTIREQACITYLAQGMTNKEIAQEIGISAYTVTDHLKRVMGKPGHPIAPASSPACSSASQPHRTRALPFSAAPR